MRSLSSIILCGGLASLLSCLAPMGLTASAATSASSTSAETGRVIVRFKANADSVRARLMTRGMTRGEVSDVAQTRATALGLRHGLSGAASTASTLRAGRSIDERTQVVVARGMTSAALAAKLAADAEVEFVAVDQRRKIAAIPNDSLFGSATPNPVITGGPLPTRVIDQWYLKAPTATTAVTQSDVVSSINAPAAWDVTTGSSSIVVAVVDTGVRFDHPDLSSKLLAGYDFIGYGESSNSQSIAAANDGNGPDSDASDPGDWVSQADVTAGTLGSSCTASDIGDSSWHGTRVSGLIGAITNNSSGMAGVSWGSMILPVRVLGKCGGYDSDIMAGMLWAAGIHVPGVPDNTTKAQVINMSLGGSGTCSGSGSGTYPGTISQVTAAGTTIVVAAGNSEGMAVGVPGNCSGVITVGGLRHVGSKVGFASIGPQVTISAPGGNCINTGSSDPCLYPIVSTVNLGTTVPTTNSYTGDSPSVGTSFSTPLVSGTVALMLSVNPNLTPAQIQTMLQHTVRPFVNSGGSSNISQCQPANNAAQDECYCTTSTCGAGMLDAAAATAAARSSVQPVADVAGQPVTVSAVSPGVTVRSVVWTVVSGSATVTPNADPTTAVVTTTATGVVLVQATVTDSTGAVTSNLQTVQVAAAAPDGTVSVASSPSSPTANQTVTLSIDSALGSGRTVASAVWTLVNGGGIVSTINGANTATATIEPTGPGSAVVSVQVTDNLGATYTAQGTITVAASLPTVTTSGASTGSSSGGGGAFSPLWLALLALACVALRRRPA